MSAVVMALMTALMTAVVVMRMGRAVLALVVAGSIKQGFRAGV